MLPAGAKEAGRVSHPLERRRLCTAHVELGGQGEHWALHPPAEFGPTGWSVERVFPPASGPNPTYAGSAFTGVYGKWNYMDGLGAFMGSIHDLTGDIWIYKPKISDFDVDGAIFMASAMDAPDFGPYSKYAPTFELSRIPEPTTVALLVAGLLGLATRRAKYQAFSIM